MFSIRYNNDDILKVPVDENMGNAAKILMRLAKSEGTQGRTVCNSVYKSMSNAIQYKNGQHNNKNTNISPIDSITDAAAKAASEIIDNAENNEKIPVDSKETTVKQEVNDVDASSDETDVSDTIENSNNEAAADNDNNDVSHKTTAEIEALYTGVEVSAELSSVSIPATVIADALLKDETLNDVIFQTAVAWGPTSLIGKSGKKIPLAYNNVYAKDFLLMLSKYGRKSIGVPVAALVSMSSDITDDRQYYVSDDKIIGTLCSFYSSFDSRFAALYYVNYYSAFSSKDDILFGCASALENKSAEMALVSDSPDSAFIGMLISSGKVTADGQINRINEHTHIPSFLYEFYRRTGKGGGKYDNYTSLNFVPDKSTTFEEHISDYVLDELPTRHGIDAEAINKAVMAAVEEKIMAKAIASKANNNENIVDDNNEKDIETVSNDGNNDDNNQQKDVEHHINDEANNNTEVENAGEENNDGTGDPVVLSLDDLVLDINESNAIINSADKRILTPTYNLQRIVLDSLTNFRPATIEMLVLNLLYYRVGCDEAELEEWLDFTYTAQADYMESLRRNVSSPVAVIIEEEAREWLLKLDSDPAYIATNHHLDAMRCIIALASFLAFRFAYIAGGAPIEVHVGIDELALAARISGVFSEPENSSLPEGIENEVINSLDLACFGIPSIFRKVFAASMINNGRGIVTRSDIIPFVCDSSDYIQSMTQTAFMLTENDCRALVDIDAHGILSAACVLFRRMIQDIATYSYDEVNTLYMIALTAPISRSLVSGEDDYIKSFDRWLVIAANASFDTREIRWETKFFDVDANKPQTNGISVEDAWNKEIGVFVNNNGSASDMFNIDNQITDEEHYRRYGMKHGKHERISNKDELVNDNETKDNQVKNKQDDATDEKIKSENVDENKDEQHIDEDNKEKENKIDEDNDKHLNKDNASLNDMLINNVPFNDADAMTKLLKQKVNKKSSNNGTIKQVLENSKNTADNEKPLPSSMRPSAATNETKIWTLPLLNQPNGQLEKINKNKKGKVGALNKFAADLVAAARDGLVGSGFVGREDELRLMETILTRRDKSNPLLLGAAGSGKTAIVEALAKRIADGTSPLSSCGLYALDIAGLVSDGNPIAAMNKLEQILEEAIATQAILFIDEIHIITSLGAGEMNAANVMKPYLARDGLRLIGATTEREYNYTLSRDRALSRRFSPMHLPALKFDAIVNIIDSKIPLYSEYHNVDFSSDYASTIALLAEDYMSGRESPDRELDIVDTAASVANAKEDKVVSEDDIVTAVKLLTSNAGVKTRKDIARDIIVNDITDEQLNDMFPNVAGQKKAKTAVAQRIMKSRLGLSARPRPKNVFMFVGESGVGKTYMATEMAPLLDASDKDVLTLSLGEYQDRASTSRLVGASPQYVGYNEGGVLTNFVKAHPHGIVILDEWEKCCNEIRTMFLGVFDTGALRAADGSMCDCRSITFVCTSNAGHGADKKHAVGFGVIEDTEEQDRKALDEELRTQFGEPLMNRIDEVVVFEELNEDDIADACVISYKKLAEKMDTRYGVALASLYSEEDIKQQAKEFCRNKKDSSDKLDARSIWNELEREIVPKAISLLTTNEAEASAE